MGRVWVAAVVWLASLAATAHAADVQIVAEDHPADRVVELTLATRAFTEPTHVDVDLPVGYAAHPKRRWPVVYWTGGTSDRYFTFNDRFDGVRLSGLQPFIVVSPDGRSGYWSDWYNGGASGPPEYETFVIDQLIPLIDSHFRTNPHRAGRAIAGESMGGYGAMMLAARHPDRFTAAASLSGAVDSNTALVGAAVTASSSLDGGLPDAINGPRATQEVRWHGHNPTDLADNLRDIDLQVRTANGVLAPDLGETAADLATCAVELAVQMATIDFDDELNALSIGHVFKQYDSGCHSDANFQRQIADTFPLLTQAFAHPRPAPAAFDYRSIEPQFDVWGWHVAADPARALEFLQLSAVRARSLTLAGSGTTTVTTPPEFTGLRRVGVTGATTPLATPDRAGGITFSVDLGAPDTGQQYALGTTTKVTTRAVALQPFARVRITKVRAARGRVKVCARATGGRVQARIKVGQASRRVTLTRRTRCRRLPRGGSVRIAGRDAFGHAVRAHRKI